MSEPELRPQGNAPPTGPSTYRRYLAVFFGASLAVAGLTVWLSLSVDPFGVSPLRGSGTLDDYVRYERSRVDRLVKPLDVLRRQPKTLLIGTSRVKQGFDPDDLRGTPLWPAYNLGIDFSSPTETAALLELLLARVPSVETAIIEVNFSHFFFPGPVTVPRSGADLAESHAKAFFSWPAVKASLLTVLKNRNFPSGVDWLHPDGLKEPGVDLMLKDIDNFFDRYLGPRLVGHWDRPLDAPRALFDRIDRACRAYAVRCIYAVFPYNPLDLAHHDAAGQWPDLEKVKRFFAARDGFYDFTQFGEFSNEPYGNDMDYWIDINHFTPRVGDHIGAVINGDRLPDTPPGFGRYVTDENIDESLQDWRRGLDDWKRANGDFVARIRDRLGVGPD